MRKREFNRSKQRVLDVNLTGSFLGIQKVAPHMCGRCSGAMVDIASSAALSGHSDPAYTASKWGVRGSDLVAGIERSKIRVTCCVSRALGHPLPLRERVTEHAAACCCRIGRALSSSLLPGR